MSNSKLFHMFNCGQLLRRDEYYDHLFFHSNVVHMEDSRFIRCNYGCEFGIEKYLPSNGKFKYDDFFGTIVHTNDVEIKENIEFPLFKLLSVLSNVKDYLDGATLNALAATCSSIRKNIYNYFPNKYMIYREWKKKRFVDGRIGWFMNGEVIFKSIFS